MKMWTLVEVFTETSVSCCVADDSIHNLFIRPNLSKHTLNLCQGNPPFWISCISVLDIVWFQKIFRSPPQSEFHLGLLWIFHFCRGLRYPQPLRNFHKCDKDPPTSLEKFIFTKKGYSSKRMRPFVVSTKLFPLIKWSHNIKTHYATTK